MNIGTKLRDARTAAQLTQEQAAEALGVSRQTISNWENAKTYPDIVSVIKMSDLYDVSLDRLLKGKEETPMSDYMKYLAESTNTVTSQKKLSMIILIAAYLVIWAFSLIMFWCVMSASDTMGFSLIFLWLLLPVTTFVISLLIGRNGYRGNRKWLACPAFGVMHMLAEYATFSTANMLAFDKINLPHGEMLLAGAAVSAVGLGIGILLQKKSRPRKNP